MAHITNEELLYIAHLSALKIAPKEMDMFRQQIDTILAYVDQIAQVQQDVPVEQVRNVNVMHDDIPVRFDSSILLERCPLHESSFFVVPKILDEK